MESNGATLGRGTRIKHSFLIDNAVTDETSTDDFSHLVTGENCYVGDLTYVNPADEVRFGDNVVVSGSVSIVTHADCNRSPVSRHFPREQGPVHIDDGEWIGFGATIMHSVTVGEQAVVAAGSVVRDDVEPGTIVGDTPAEQIGEVGGSAPPARSEE